MNNWVILFVRTGSERKIMGYIQENLNPDIYIPFLPTKEIPRKNNGVVSKIHKLLFPCYIFIQTPLEADQISKEIKIALCEISKLKSFYSILHYGSNKKDIVVRADEKQNWERILDNDYNISGSTGFIEGELIHVLSGALVGLECKIKQINRHKREAIVAMEIMGEVREVKVMLEIISKI